jgi:hypothetical protein
MKAYRGSDAANQHHVLVPALRLNFAEIGDDLAQLDERAPNVRESAKAVVARVRARTPGTSTLVTAGRKPAGSTAGATR